MQSKQKLLTDEEKRRVRAMREKKKEKARRLREPERPDFVSAMLVRWRLSELLRATRVLLALIEHRDHQAQPCAYYDSLFTDYAALRITRYYGEETVSFAVYYRQAYEQALSEEEEEDPGRRAHTRKVLRGLFLCLLAYDERVRRFVFARHDVTRLGLGVEWHGLSSQRGLRFAAACRPIVVAFLVARIDLIELHDACVARWEEEYMFHTVQRPSASNTMEQMT